MAIIALILGKHKVLPVFYSAREGILPYVPHNAPSVDVLLQQPKYSLTARKFYDTLKSVIMERYSISRRNANRQIADGVDTYLNQYSSQVKNGIIKRDASKEIVKGEPGYPYYNNLQAIREWERMEYFIRHSLLLGLNG